MRPPDDRFWTSSRGQVLALLRRGVQTVGELAAALELTGNAVRAHLTGLERDGLVRPMGTRRGPRKPTVTYAVTPEAEQLFPKEYGPILRNLLDELRDRLPAEQLDDVARAAARRFARTFRAADPAAGRAERVDRAEDVLRALGGCCERQAEDGSVVLGCSVCPLAIATEAHPEVCRLVETLLAEVVDIPVRNHCQRTPPRCRFEIAGPVRRRKAAS